MRKTKLTALALAAILMGVSAYPLAAAPTEITDTTLTDISIGSRGDGTEGEYRINPGGGTLAVSEAVFIDSWDAVGSKVTLGAGNNLIVGTSVDPNADKDFEIQASVGLTRFILEEGSKIQVVGNEAGINIGTSYDGGGQTKSQLIVEGGNNLGSAVTIEADSFFHIFGKGELLVEDNSTVNIDMTNASGGYFLTGRYAGDLAINPDADPASFAGGLFRLEGNSQANIDGNAYFGAGGIVDVGLNTLNIDGDALFKADSIYTVARTESAAGKIAVTGDVTIENGAKVELANAQGLDLTNITGGNSVILTANSFTDGTLFTNPLYSFKIEDAGGGKQLRVDKYLGSKSVVENAASAGGSGMSGNYVNATGLIDRVIQGGTASSNLVNSLVGNLEAIDNLAEAGDPQAEKALKQLIGEEALASVNATIDTVLQVQNTQSMRLNNLLDYNQAPAAGYGAALNRVWLSGFGNWTRQKNKNNVYGYDYDAGGVVLGYDREVESLPGLTLGLSGAWSSGELKNKDGLSQTDIDTMSLGFYGLYEFRNGFFLDGNINYAHSDNDSSTRLVVGGRKEGSFDSNTWQMGLNLGYTHYLTPETKLIPSVGIQYIHVKQDAWREKIVSDPHNIAVANWYDEVKNDFVEFPVKLRLNTTFAAGSNCDILITPELRVGGTFVANKPESRMRMGFVGSGDSMVINGINPGRNRYQVGTGIKVQVNDLVDIYANYDYEGRSGFSSHNATAGLGFSF